PGRQEGPGHPCHWEPDASARRVCCAPQASARGLLHASTFAVLTAYRSCLSLIGRVHSRLDDPQHSEVSAIVMLRGIRALGAATGVMPPEQPTGPPEGASG